MRRIVGPVTAATGGKGEPATTARRTRTVARRRSTLAVGAAAGVLAIGGLSACGGGTSNQSAPPPTTTAPPAPSSSTAESTSVVGPTMPRSKPTDIAIPAIGVDHAVRPTGLNKDGTMHTPPLSEVQWPDWYKYSPTPGQQGPSVIVGHINSAKYGPGIFSKLDDITKGDTVNVKRKDGTTAHFTIYKKQEFPKSDFPTRKVYGNTHRAELRLITCGGSFNKAKHSYRDNIVAYARLSKDKA
jgi:hypothetical protein